MTYGHFDAKQDSLTYINGVHMYVVTGMWHTDKYWVGQLTHGICFINWPYLHYLFIEKWHVVKVASNKLRLRGYLVWWLILIWRIELLHLYWKLTISSLIIHRKVTCCQTSIKETQIKVKFCAVTNIGIENLTMTFISKIDNFLINYS